MTIDEGQLRQQNDSVPAAVHDPFFEYYARESVTASTLLRFEAVRSAVERELIRCGRSAKALDVADVGCGAGTQCLIWARQGHRVRGLDINPGLLDLARARARDASVSIDFRAGSATALPFDDASVDVCLVPELLEHVADWEACIDEFTRILRPGGLLYLSTTNRLCPKQAEFDLPFYSWYPRPLQRHYEQLAVTSRPELANFAKYPAVHWFTFYGLRAALARRGFESRDRFDLIDLAKRGWPVRALVGVMRAFSPLRWLGQVCTPYTVVLACKLPKAR